MERLDDDDDDEGRGSDNRTVVPRFLEVFPSLPRGDHVLILSTKKWVNPWEISGRS